MKILDSDHCSAILRGRLDLAKRIDPSGELGVSAIKAGDALSPEQQQALLDELLQAYAPATCPHGRPVFVTLRLEELDRRFLRR